MKIEFRTVHLSKVSASHVPFALGRTYVRKFGHTRQIHQDIQVYRSSLCFLCLTRYQFELKNCFFACITRFPIYKLLSSPNVLTSLTLRLMHRRNGVNCLLRKLSTLSGDYITRSAPALIEYPTKRALKQTSLTFIVFVWEIEHSLKHCRDWYDSQPIFLLD